MGMIFYALCCVSVIFLAVTFSAIFERRFEETAALAVFTEILLLYIAGFLGQLAIGAIAVLVISVIALLVSVCICLSAARFKDLAVNTFTLGFVAFLILIVLIYRMSEAATAGSSPVVDAIKLMLENNSFAKVGVSSIGKIGYQPGYSLFGFFFTTLNGSFSEADVIRGANIFAAAMILPVMSRMKWKVGYIGIFVIPAMYLLPWTVYSNIPVFNVLSADTAVALVFAFMLSTYMCCEQSGYVYWTLGLGSAVLCLMRPGAEFVAALMLIIVILDIAAFGFFETRDMFEKPGRWISIVAYFALTGAAFLSWWVYSWEHSITRIFDCIYITEARSENFEAILSQITSAISGSGTSSNGHISYLVWILIIAVLGGAAAALADGFWNRIRAGIQAFIVIIGFFIYIYMLAFVYTYIFPVGTDITETLDLFMAGYIFAAFMFSVCFVINKIMDRFATFGRLIVLAVVALVIVLSPVKEAYAVMVEETLNNPLFSLSEHFYNTKVTHFRHII